jgi:cation diffusion facilitator family transporter
LRHNLTETQINLGLKEKTLREETAGFQAGERIAFLSVWTLLTLGIIEIVFGQFTGSISLFADGIDSLSDAAVSFFVWTGLHFALRRPSKRFPFGYYKVESLTALLAAVLLVGAASFIFLRSYRAIVNPHVISLPFIALVVLAITGLLSLYRALQMRRIANRYNILSLRVDARNSIKDTSSSFVAFTSVLISFLGFTQMDAIGGFLVGIYVLTVSYVALRESSLVLLDAFHEPELTHKIEKIIQTHKEIKGLKDLKLRRAGPFIVGILEVIVAGDMTVSEMHEVITELEHSIRERIPGLRSLTVKAIPS